VYGFGKADGVIAPPIETGPWLRHRRKELRLSLDDLHQATGLSLSYIAKIERGDRPPTPKALREIRRALEIPAEEAPDVIGAALSLGTLWKRPAKDEGGSEGPWFVRRILELAARPGLVVLDPFAGTGSFLFESVKYIQDGRAYAIEIDERSAEALRMRGVNWPGSTKTRVIPGSVEQEIRRIGRDAVDLVLTEPPLWVGAPDEGEARVSEDLGRAPDYHSYLRGITRVFGLLRRSMRRNGACVVLTRDMRRQDKYLPVHSDLLAAIRRSGLSPQGTIVIEDPGHPDAQHAYLLLFRRTWESEPARPTVRRPEMPSRVTPQGERRGPTRTSGKEFRRFADTGHPRHSIVPTSHGLSSSVASQLIEEHAASATTILNPWCGVGSVAFEAALRGKRVIAIAENRLAYVATSAKVNPPEPEEVREVLNEIDNAVLEGRFSGLAPEVPEALRRTMSADDAAWLSIARESLVMNSRDFRLSRAHLFVAAVLAGIVGRPVHRGIRSALHDACERHLGRPLPRRFVRGEVHLVGSSAIDRIPFGEVDAMVAAPERVRRLRRTMEREYLQHWLLNEEVSDEADSQARIPDAFDAVLAFASDLPEGTWIALKAWSHATALQCERAVTRLGVFEVAASSRAGHGNEPSEGPAGGAALPDVLVGIRGR